MPPGGEPACPGGGKGKGIGIFGGGNGGILCGNGPPGPMGPPGIFGGGKGMFGGILGGAAHVNKLE